MHKGHLAQAEGHVMEGEQRVAHQRQLIERLARDDHDTTDAHVLRETLQQSLALAYAHRQQILVVFPCVLYSGTQIARSPQI